MQHGMRVPSPESQAPAAPLRVQPNCNGKRLEQCGLAHAVLAHEHGHRGPEVAFGEMPHRREVEGMSGLDLTLSNRPSLAPAAAYAGDQRRKML